MTSPNHIQNINSFISKDWILCIGDFRSLWFYAFSSFSLAGLLVNLNHYKRLNGKTLPDTRIFKAKQCLIKILCLDRKKWNTQTECLSTLWWNDVCKRDFSNSSLKLKSNLNLTQLNVSRILFLKTANFTCCSNINPSR